MRRRSFLTGTGAVMALLAAQGTQAAATGLAGPSPTDGEWATNPLLQAYTGPWQTPPWAAIQPGHFEPAFNTAMTRAREELAAIATQTAAPTFDNTMAPMELAGAALTRVVSAFYTLAGAHTSDEIQAVEARVGPKLAAHFSAIAQDPALFARVKAIHDTLGTSGLDPVQRRLVERAYVGFVNGGALLDAAGKARVAEIEGRLAELQTRFGQNVLADQSSFVLPLTEEAHFDGLPPALAGQMRAAASERGLDALGAVTLSRSSFEPFLTFSARRDLRQKVQEGWMAVGSRGETDNRPLIVEIVNLRTEKARLLGHASFAAYQLADKMAKTPQAAMDMMMGVWAPALATAERDRAALQAMADSEGQREPLASWDWWHYAEKVRKARFDVDEGELKPYFELNNMIAAMHWNAGQLFGISFHQRDDIPGWHPDVVAYEVRDAAGQPMALWFGDWFARPSKQSGAWMSSLRDQQKLAGTMLPVTYNVCNYIKPQAGEPCLLSADDVITLFHEFGHALHGMLSNVTYPSQSGTNVLRDFVEFPSQVLEHWALVPEVLSRFARHYATGEVIPAALVDRLTAAGKFNQGWATVEFLSAAIMDMKMHMIEGPAPTDVDAWEREILDGIGLIPEIVVRYRPGYFKHTFEGGYAAGYYSYIWAAVLESDAANAFTEAGSMYDPALAARLKTEIFAAGDTADPMELYVRFRGREPGVGPLLEQRGLVPA